MLLVATNHLEKVLMDESFTRDFRMKRSCQHVLLPNSNHSTILNASKNLHTFSYPLDNGGSDERYVYLPSVEIEQLFE
jgi:hypothetical protein